jgi:phage protein D
MEAVMRGRRAKVQVIYAGKDVSADLAPYIIDLTFNDNESGKADDLSLTLDDRDRLWATDWWMEKSDSIEASILCEDEWLPDQTAPLKLSCGTFSVDELESSGPPDRVTVKAIAVPLNKAIKRTRKSKAWESLTIKAIAEEMAGKADMDLVWESDSNPLLNREDQRDESDLGFLARVTAQYGLNLKVHDNQIVVFGDAKYEAAEPLDTITRGESRVISYRFKYQAGSTGSKKASTSIFDVIAGMPITGEATDEQLVSVPPDEPEPEPQVSLPLEDIMSIPEDDPYSLMSVEEETHIEAPVGSQAEAETVSKEKLRSQNKKGWQCSLSLVGDPRIATGLTVTLSGWGRYDGKWQVERCSHKVGGGYTTSCELYRARL